MYNIYAGGLSDRVSSQCGGEDESAEPKRQTWLWCKSLFACLLQQISVGIFTWLTLQRVESNDMIATECTNKDTTVMLHRHTLITQ